jgi:threonine dehydrogenase-like Zn-dependent dehydrogenase
MAAYSSLLRGASRVLVVDRHPDRLGLAQKIGAIAIDDSQAPAVDQVLELTDGEGVDKGLECVGYQAHDSEGDEDPTMTMNELVRSVRATGALGKLCAGARAGLIAGFAHVTDLEEETDGRPRATDLPRK